MARRKNNVYGKSHARSEWPKVPAPKGYVYNVNGAILNWPYCLKKMLENGPDFCHVLDQENLTIQEYFIRFCEMYENDTGAEFELNTIPED